MGRAARLHLEPGERHVLVVRRHWWTLVRPALNVVFSLAALPCFALLEYLFPALDLVRFTLFSVALDLAVSAVLALRWLAVDLLPWLAERYILTTRRVVECRGVIRVERREAPLRTIQETNYAISGSQGRFFDFGDLRLQGTGRGKEFVFRAAPHPRRLQTLLAGEARAAREEYHRLQPPENEISAALGRIFSIQSSVHDSPTQYVPVLSHAAVRAQRRLSLLSDETVVLATRPHIVLLVGALIGPLALGLVAVALSTVSGFPMPPWLPVAIAALLLLWLAWATFDWANDEYVLTTERLMRLRRTPLLAETRSVAQVRAVDDVVLRINSLGGRLFDLGTLTVKLEGEDLAFEGLPHPERWQRAIFEQQDAAHRRDRLREQERLAGTLTDWFTEYHRMQQGSP